MKLKHLNVSNKDAIHSINFGEISGLISKCHYLEEFFCNYNDLSSYKDVNIFEPFKTITTLKRFEIQHCSMNFNDIISLREFLSNKKYLENFDLSGNILSFQFVIEIFHQIETTNSCKKFGFSINDNKWKLNFDDSSKFFEEMKTIIDKSMWLRKIENLSVCLNFHLFEANSKENRLLEQLIDYLNNINSLKIYQYDSISMHKRKNYANYFLMIDEDLFFKGHEKFDFKFITHDFLRSLNDKKTITSLFLSSCNLTDYDITQLLQADNLIYNLKEIDLSFNLLSDECLKDTMNSINHENISLINFECTDRTLDFLEYLENLQIKFENLKYLNVRKREKSVDFKKIISFLRGISEIMINLEELYFLFLNDKLNNDFFSLALLRFQKLKILNYPVGSFNSFVYKVNTWEGLDLDSLGNQSFGINQCFMDTTLLLHMRKKNQYQRFEVSKNLDMSKDLIFYIGKDENELCIEEIVIDYNILKLSNQR